MRNFLCLLSLCLLCLGCIEDQIKRPLNPEEPAEEKGKFLAVATLPVHIDSTNYLIHPVGKIEVREGYYGSDSHNSGSPVSGDSFYGNFSNLRFQEFNSEALTALTAQNIRIRSVHFLREIFNNTGKQLLLYNVVDTDTNTDEKLTFEDREALYISTINGGKFKKITPSNQVVLEFRVVPAMNRLYFRSLQDSNNNGEPDAEEKFHYYFVDLASEALKVKEYFPVGA